MIELNNLFKTYNYKKNDAFEALHDISLKIEKGTFTAIIGKSGSGKSTLMHILGCIDSFEKGTYLFNGTDIAKMNDKERALFRSKNIGIVLQDFALIETYTVIENIMVPFYFSNVKFDKKKLKEKALAVLTDVGMDGMANKMVNKLSGGQKQRVAIARALVNDPEIILADEPTGALDSKTSAEIVALFENLYKAGKTVVIITHDLEIANKCCRIIEISDGRI